jgi:hypothetical protein
MQIVDGAKVVDIQKLSKFGKLYNQAAKNGGTPQDKYRKFIELLKNDSELSGLVDGSELDTTKTSAFLVMRGLIKKEDLGIEGNVYEKYMS